MTQLQFTCKRCLYTTKAKWNLSNHLKRKEQCNVVENGQDIDVNVLFDELCIRKKKSDTICEFCKKQYASASTLSRHRKSCKTKQNENIPVEDDLDIRIMNAVRKVIREEQVPTTQNIQNTNNTQNITININAYGSEDLSYLTHDFLTQCVLNLTEDGIPNLVKSVHLNDEHSENKNIRPISYRDKTLETYDGEQWRMYPSSKIVRSLIKKGCKVLHTHYYKNINTDFSNESLQEYIDRNIRELTDLSTSRKPRAYYELQKNLVCMFFNEKRKKLEEEKEKES